MSEQLFEIAIPGRGAVTALRVTPDRPGPVTFVYAPGAGSNLGDPFGAFASAALAAHGIETVRIQFLYMQAKKRAPDRTPVLEATWRAVIDALLEKSKIREDDGTLAHNRAGGDNRLLGGNKIVVGGGRSMGGRIASQVVAQGVAVDGVALFAYPLHQPGRPERARDQHLPSIEVPAFFCSGTRDAFASPEELTAAAGKAPRSTVHLLDGADHGFAVLKSSGRTREDVWREAVDAFLHFLAASQLLPPGED